MGLPPTRQKPSLLYSLSENISFPVLMVKVFSGSGTIKSMVQDSIIRTNALIDCCFVWQFIFWVPFPTHHVKMKQAGLGAVLGTSGLETASVRYWVGDLTQDLNWGWLQSTVLIFELPFSSVTLPASSQVLGWSLAKGFSGPEQADLGPGVFAGLFYGPVLRILQWIHPNPSK